MDPIKLDNFSKILLATAQINYQAASLNGVVEQQKLMGLRTEIGERIRQTDEVLQNAANSLTQIMVRMADYINNVDCICPLDVRVSRVPFEILVHGKDETEKSYEEEDPKKAFWEKVYDGKPVRAKMIKPDWVPEAIENKMNLEDRERYRVLCNLIDRYNKGVYEFPAIGVHEGHKAENATNMVIVISRDNNDGIVVCHPGGCIRYDPKYEGA